MALSEFSNNAGDARQRPGNDLDFLPSTEIGKGTNIAPRLNNSLKRVYFFVRYGMWFSSKAYHPYYPGSISYQCHQERPLTSAKHIAGKKRLLDNLDAVRPFSTYPASWQKVAVALPCQHRVHCLLVSWNYLKGEPELRIAERHEFLRH